MSENKGAGFDIAAAVAAREKGIIDVERNADEVWKSQAIGAIRQLCYTRQFFTSDDVWRALTGTIPEPRAMGAVMRTVASQKFCEPTDRTVLSERVACHRRPIRVWRSLVFRGGEAGSA